MWCGWTGTDCVRRKCFLLAQFWVGTLFSSCRAIYKMEVTGLLIKALVWFEKCEHVCALVLFEGRERTIFFVSVFLFFLSLSFFSRSEQQRMDSCEITFDTKHK